MAAKPLLAVQGWFIALLGAVAVSGAACLVPGKRELAKRMMADGNSARVLEMVQQETDPEACQKMKAAALEAMRDHAEKCGVAGSSGDAGLRDPEVALSQLLALSTEPKWIESAKVNLSVLAARLPSIPKALELLRPVAEALPAPDCLPVYAVMAERSLAEGNPAQAAAWHAKAAERGPLGWEQLSQQIVACRYCERAPEALAALEGFLKRTPVENIPALATELQITLLREAGKSGEAFDLMKAQFAATSDEKEKGEIFARLMDCAEESDRGKELLALGVPLMQTESEWKLSPAEFVGKSKEHESFLAKCRLLGPLAEWNDQSQAALEFHLRAAAGGDIAAALRADELSTDLLAEGEWYKVLRLISPVKEHPELELRVAQLAGDETDYAVSVQHYQNWLAANPADGQAWFELGSLWEEQGRISDAAESMQRAVKCLPERLDCVTALASYYICLNRINEAVELYDSLPAGVHTPQTLENFALAAEAAGNPTAIFKAWRTLCDRFPAERTSENYLRLAESYTRLGNENQAEAALREGVAALPHSATLKIALSNQLNDLNEPGKAAEVLCAPELARNQQATELWLSIVSGRSATQEIVQHAVKLVPGSSVLDDASKARLATILDDGNMFTLAENVLGLASRPAAHWHELARAKYDGGDLEAALNCERQYLSMTTTAAASEWTFLGDVLEELGRLKESQAAYQRAAETLMSKSPVANLPAAGNNVTYTH